MQKYDSEVENQMRTFFQTLSEKDKRQYAALEARKVGFGGQTYIAKVLGVSRKTIQRGQAEIEQNKLPPKDRIRRPGAGRKPFDKKRDVKQAIS